MHPICSDGKRLDGLFAAMGSDRDRLQVMDLSKWNDNHAVYERILNVLRGETVVKINANAVSGNSSSDSISGHGKCVAYDMSNLKSQTDHSALGDSDHGQGQVSLGSKETSTIPSTTPHLDTGIGTLPENDFLLKEMGKGKGREVTGATMDVCFDGEKHRVQASFDVKLGEGAGKGGTEVELNGTDNASTAAWVEEHLIGAMSQSREGVANSGNKASISLKSVGGHMKESAPVRLADRILIAKEEDDFIARMIRSDQKSYKDLVQACATRVNTIIKSNNWNDETSSTTRQRKNWKSIEMKYAKQRVWRKVATCMTKGMKRSVAGLQQAQGGGCARKLGHRGQWQAI